MQYILSYQYVSDPVEHKRVFQTVSQVLQEVEQLLRGNQTIQSIRIAPKPL